MKIEKRETETRSELNDPSSEWKPHNDIPVDSDSPVLVLCEDSDNLQWQYVCWPPEGDTGWLMCLPSGQDIDIDLSRLSNINVIGWKRLRRCRMQPVKI